MLSLKDHKVLRRISGSGKKKKKSQSYNKRMWNIKKKRIHYR